MGHSLRAFLMLRAGGGEWTVQVFREFEPLLDAWLSRPEPELSTGVLHVGFDRPASQQFDKVVMGFAGRLLVTSAARGALPPECESSTDPIGQVEHHPLYLALRGWGYVAEVPKVSSTPPNDANVISLQGWVKAFADQNPVDGSYLPGANIVDDASYLLHESLLPKDVRYRLGIFRYRSTVRPHSDNPCEIIRAAPPWLLDRELITIDLSVRLSNALASAHMTRVRDLLPYDARRLLSIQNLGRKSIGDLHFSLLKALDEGPFDISERLSAASAEPLMAEISKALAQFDERERDILVRRMGFGLAQQTLQEIGDIYGITRERIRQLEAKSVAQIGKSQVWDDLLLTKLDGLLLGREFPLPVLGLEAVDPWFVGIGKAVDVLKYVVDCFCHNRISVLRIDDIDYVGRLSQDQWAKIVHEGQKILASGSKEQWSEAHCRTMIAALLPTGTHEFSSLLWQHVAVHCHFVQKDDGSVLASVGRGADHVVQAVLADAEEPLHFSEIAERARRRSGKEFDVRRAHNAAAATGILLGRGRYGSERHLNVPAAVREAVRDDLQEVIDEGPDGRQWHCSELLTIIAERNPDAASLLDKYKIDFLLRQSNSLRRLGRMTWEKNTSSSKMRIDVRQAIATLLQQSGGPLNAKEIRQRLVAVRGVGEHFQISSSDKIVKIAPSLWGLNDRDISLKRPEQAKFVEFLVNALSERGEGVHASEIESVVGGSYGNRGLSSDTIFSLALTDDRLQANSAEYLFLREWGDARRVTLATAVLETLRSGAASYTVDELVGEAERRTRRVCDRRGVVICLRALEANLDTGTGRWSIGAVETEPDVEEGPEASLPTRAPLASVDWV